MRSRNQHICGLEGFNPAVDTCRGCIPPPPVGTEQVQQLKFGDEVKLADGYDYGSLRSADKILIVFVSDDLVNVATSFGHYIDLPARMFTIAKHAQGERLREKLDNCIRAWDSYSYEKYEEWAIGMSKAIDAARAKAVGTEVQQWMSIGHDEPWPLKDVLLKLADAVDHLHNDHDCDHHGWEEVHYCAVNARKFAAIIAKNAPGELTAQSIVERYFPTVREVYVSPLSVIIPQTKTEKIGGWQAEAMMNGGSTISFQANDPGAALEILDRHCKAAHRKEPS